MKSFPKFTTGSFIEFLLFFYFLFFGLKFQKSFILFFFDLFLNFKFSSIHLSKYFLLDWLKLDYFLLLVFNFCQFYLFLNHFLF